MSFSRRGSTFPIPRSVVTRRTSPPSTDLASERANLFRDERADFRVVRNRQGALEALRLVGQVVAAGDRDELVRAVRRLGPCPSDLQEVVPPEVHLLRLDRLELHVHVPPALLFVFHSVSPPKFEGIRSAVSDGGPRNRRERY